MSIMNDIEYGFKDKDGFNIINDTQKWDNDFNSFYYLQEPDELLSSKCGVCWDQVELERKLFDELNIKNKTYFIYIKEDDMLPSHTFLVYEDGQKYYWFEHSWMEYRGIFKYDSLDELLLDVVNKFINSHDEIKKGLLYVYEYQKPIRHIKCMDFYNWVSDNGKLIYEKQI